MKRNRRWYLIIGGLMVGSILLVALFAEQLTTVSPYYFHTKKTILEGTPPFRPSAAALLGTDQNGRDVWSRIAFGARWSLLFAFLIMGARMLIAMPMAILAAFGPKWTNWIVNKLYVFTSAIPPLLIYLLILSAPGLREIGLWPCVAITVALLTLMEWPRIAVVLRGRLEELGHEPFVEGAVAAGATRGHIFWAHLMPHLWPTLLQVTTAEMARGLLNIAQLGFFGIWVGGGIIDLFETLDNGRAIWIVSTGVPEWGTLLAGAREYVSIAPWIPLAPAFAFFVGVVGFNLLSQGLEGLVFSVAGLREWLTPKVKWTIAGVAAAALIAGVLWRSSGLPWGQQSEILQLAERQAAALNTGDIDKYLETLLPDVPGLREGQRKWLSAIPREGLQVAVVSPMQMDVNGGEARGLWSISFGYADRPPITVTRSAHLIRRGGQWFDAGENLTLLRGLHTDIEAFYDPTNPTREAAGSRYTVNLIASVADHAYKQATESLPTAAVGNRASLRLYPSHEAFAMAIRGEGAPVDVTRVTAWQSPDQVLHISPLFLKGLNRRYLQQALAFEMLKFLSISEGMSPQALPLLAGAMEVKAVSPNPYELYITPLPGRQLFELPELFKLRPEDLTQAVRPVFTAQSALLIEFLGQSISQEQVFDLARQTDGDILSSLAKATGTDEAKLGESYRQYVYDRITERSIMHLPGGKARVPQTLLNGIAGRTKAALTSDPASFLAFHQTADDSEAAAWHKMMQAEGLVQYEAALLDMDQNSEPEKKENRVTVLERFTFSDGRVAMGISVQNWTEDQGTWRLASIETPWTPARR